MSIKIKLSAVSDGAWLRIDGRLMQREGCYNIHGEPFVKLVYSTGGGRWMSAMTENIWVEVLEGVGVCAQYKTALVNGHSEPNLN